MLPGKVVAELIHEARISSQRAIECLQEARSGIGFNGTVSAPNEVVAEITGAEQALTKAVTNVVYLRNVLTAGSTERK